MSYQRINLFQRLWMLAIIVSIALSIAACGRKGVLDQPTDTEYPRSYPSK